MSTVDAKGTARAAPTAGPSLAPCSTGLERIPLSLTQQGLWVVQQLDPRSGAYNTCRAFRVKGALDAEALEACMQALVNRHEILRTVFPAIAGEPVQRIIDDVQVRLVEEDLSHLAHLERERAVLVRAGEEGRQPFDIEHGPLFRTKYFRCGDASGVLVLTFHHMVFDAWSMRVFMDELTALYDGFCRDAIPTLPVLPVQYADFALWQRKRWQGRALDREVEHWRQRLSGAPPLLELPLDHPRPPTQGYRGEVVRFDLGERSLVQLRALSRRAGATTFMTVLAAFCVWVSRYTGQCDLVIGTPIANRNRRELEGLVGFFVNMLALRVNMEDDPSFELLVQRVRQVCIEAFEHQELAFERLVEALNPPRSLSHAPLVQIVFSFQRKRMPRALGPVWLSPLELDLGTAKVDLALDVREEGGVLFGAFEYNADLYNRESVERFARHFSILLEGAAATPNAKISELPMLTQAERQLVLVDWNATDSDFSTDHCIHQLFEQQAERTPESPAVVFEDHSLTYSELNARANALAHYLRSLGVGPDVLVALCVERSVEMVVGLLGILKAGGAYLPLDPTYPRERLAFMLEDSQSQFLLTQAELVEILPSHTSRVVCLDSAWPDISTHGDDNPVNCTAPEHLAYVIYTSGSTGRPKGTQLHHRGLVNLANTQKEAFGLQPTDRVLQFSSFSFDASVWETVMALTSGARLCLARSDDLLPGVGLSRVIARHEISVATLPPSVAEVLPDVACNSLHTLILAGEACSKELVARWAPGRRLFNAYGPTESTVCATLTQCQEGETDPSIGRAIANTQTYILDKNLNPLPIGIPGELHIGGAQLARGYLNRPELTTERFIPNPFSEAPGARLYKTGDLARFLPDGNIEYLGRSDHQVKVRGFRIELGEIEATLASVPGVAASVATATEQAGADRRLVAYVVPSRPGGIEPGELREHLRTRLPDYMVPTTFVILDALPLTASGKVDRGALPPPAPDRHEPNAELAPPRSDSERRLATLWQELLGIDSVGIDEDFFAIGGHSLLAVRLLTRIERTFGRNVPLATFFAHPTIKAIAVFLEQQRAAEPASGLLALQPRGTRPPFFCVPGGATGIAMKDLALYLGQEQPFYVLQPEGIEDGQTPRESVEEMAKRHIDDLRMIQPAGPYFLGGRCFGGLVAYEMAQQFKRSGEEVRLLAIIDMMFPPAHERSRRALLTPAQRTTLAPGLPEQFRPLFTAQEQARDRYLARYYPGKLTLLCNLEASPLALGRWRRLAESVEYKFVPGDHFTMLEEPHVRELAARLGESLSAAVS